MKKKIDTVDLISLGLPIFTASAVILRTLAFILAFDENVGYFDSGALITHLDRSFIIVTALFGVAVALLTQKGSLPECDSPATVWSTFAALTLGFVFAIFSLLFGILNLPTRSVIIYAIIASAIASAFYFFLEGFKPRTSVSSGRILIGLLPIVSLLLLIFVENFDFNVALNSTEKILATFIFAATSLYIIQRLKFSANVPSPRFHLWCAYLVALLGAYFAIPGIIASCMKVLDDPKYLSYYFLALGISGYAFADLFGRLRIAKLDAETVINGTDTTI